MEIMNPLTSSHRNKMRVACLLAAGFVPQILAAEVTLQKAPPLTVEQAPAYPENLARYHLGAQIEAFPQSTALTKLQLSAKAEDRNSAEAALLCDDPTTGYALANGTTTLLVSLPNIENVASLSFFNSDAKGEVSIATSSAKLPPDSPQWHAADKAVALANGPVSTKIGPSEAKYLRLTFNVSQPGRIAAFGVYANPAVSDFTMPRPRKVSFDQSSEAFALVSYNFTDLHAKARTLYVSSGSDLKQVNNMIDDQPATTYSFAADDRTPTTVIDLGKTCTLRRLSTLFSGRAGNVDFYVMGSLPVKQEGETAEFSASDVQLVANTGAKSAVQPADLPKNVRINDDFFDKVKPVGSVVNNGSEGRAAVDFPPTQGRYVLLRWNTASGQSGPLAVAEIAAFGSSKDAGARMASSDGKRSVDGKQVADGKSMMDNKDIPAEGPAPEQGPQAPGEGPPGVPPNLPAPPPFTFIPLVPPVAPASP